MTTTIEERPPTEATQSAPLLRNFIGGKWTPARTNAAPGEFRRAIEVVDFAIGMPTLIAGYNVPQVSRGIDTMMERYPVGVATAITPFNFPFVVPFWTLPIAIAAGNTFILKPPQRTPL